MKVDVELVGGVRFELVELEQAVGVGPSIIIDCDGFFRGVQAANGIPIAPGADG